MQIMFDSKGRRETFSGTYGGTTGTTISRTSAAFGTITVSVPNDPNGQITGTVTNSPDPDIRRVEFAMTRSSAAITIVHTHFWSHGDVETETLTLTK
jgi:hypothetical protein